MESERAVQLAADILLDHFGHAAQRVGVVLLERGVLSMQQILRFVNETEDIEEEPLRFFHVRNALLAMMQHGLVTARASVPEEEGRVAPQLYNMHLEEVLSRMRFSHYLEYTEAHHGSIAFQIVAAVLRYGRVSRAFAFDQVHLVEKGISNEDIDSVLRRLLRAGLLCPCRPCMALTEPAMPVAEHSLESEKEAVRDSGKKRKVLGSDGEDRNIVYTIDRRTFNLCLIKMLLCGHVEEFINDPRAARVVGALASEIKYVSYGRNVEVSWMSFAELTARMQELGYHEPGRDPAREQTKIRKILDLMSGNSDSPGTLLKKRVKKRIDEAKVKDGMTADEPEWCVDWQEARNKLKAKVTSQLIRDQFGLVGLRIFNMLNNYLDRHAPPQKLEDTYIFSTCMVDPTKGREILNLMTRRHIVKWQQVAKNQGFDQNLFNSYWLYYVDRKHVDMAILHDVFQAAFNLRLRFRTEVQREIQRGVPLEGLQVTSLTAEERHKREQCYRVQDILERSHLVLDSVLLVFCEA